MVAQLSRYGNKEGFIAITAGDVPERLGFAIRANITVDVEPGMIRQVAQHLINLKDYNPCDQCHEQLGYDRQTDDDLAKLREKWQL